MHHSSQLFFSFDSSSEKITRRGGKLRHKRDLSSNEQTNNNTSERTKERREQNRKSWHTWPPLSLLLRFWCFPIRRRRRLVEEGGGGAKEAPIIRWQRFQRIHHPHIQTTLTRTIQRTSAMKTTTRRRRRASFSRRRSIRREGDGGGVEQRIIVITLTTIRPKKKKN